MRTLQEKYNGISEGKFPKSQFVRDARLELPNLITQFNGFEDTVNILKNKGMLQEAKKQDMPKYDKPVPGYSLESLERAVDYELEAMGVNTAINTPNPEQLKKAEDKAKKNLEKHPNHYLHLMSGDSKKVDKHDKYVEVKKDNFKDTFNGMKKAELRESILEKAMEKGYTKEQVETALNRLKEKKGKDHDGDGDIDSDDYTIAKDKAIKANMSEGRRGKIKGGKVVTENDYETGGYVEAMGPHLERALKNLIQVWDEWKSGPMTKPGMIPFAKKDLVSFLDTQLAEVEQENIKTIEEKEEVYEGAINSDYKYIYKKIVQKYPDLVGGTHNWNLIKSFVDDEIDNIEITDTQDILNKFQEYRRKKFRGVLNKSSGRETLKENIHNTASMGGVVGGRDYSKESQEDKEASLEVRDLIKSGISKEEAISKISNKYRLRPEYLKRKYTLYTNDDTSLEEDINEQHFDDLEAAKEYARKESEQGYVQHVNKHPRGGYRVEDWLDGNDTVSSYQGGTVLEDHTPTTEDRYTVRFSKENNTFQVWEGDHLITDFATKEKANQYAERENAKQGLNENQLKFAMKGIIQNILSEQLISEAATGNLSKIADTYNDFEGMQTAINSLENIVTDIESYYSKTREKIQDTFDKFKEIKNPEGINMGALLAPAIQAAFMKDLVPVREKGFTKGLTLPQVRMIKPGEIQEDELEEKKIVYAPVNESRKTKYTKRK